MSIELNVLARAVLLESFELSVGTHSLGSGDGCDLLLSSRHAPPEVCQVLVSPGGQVELVAAAGTAIQGWDDETVSALSLENGTFADLGGLRLTLLVRERPRDVAVKPATSAPVTAPSRGLRPPPRETLALRVRTRRSVEVVRLDEPQLVLGRGDEAQVSFTLSEVSRRHARVLRKPDGFWIQDLGSTQGTFLNGHPVTEAAWPVGGRVTLSEAPDAPQLELVSWAEALAAGELDEAVAPLIGRSPGMKDLRDAILRYADADQSVLISGETGTGKELVAEAIWALRGRKGKFIPVNCGVFHDGNLLESRLFGYVRGAFTGAVTDKAGYFEAAGEGVVFLDEIGELPLALQASLLRVLESGQYSRVGDHTLRPVRARVVCATHRDLLQMVVAGTFREDLYHRIAALEIDVPPLRARTEDIPALARRALGQSKGRAAGKALSEDALARLQAHAWPGNVRELFRVVERAALHTEGREIATEAIVFKSDKLAAGSAGAGALLSEGGSLPEQLEALERVSCVRALEKHGYRLTAAAAELGIHESSLRRALKRLKIRTGGEGEG